MPQPGGKLCKKWFGALRSWSLRFQTPTQLLTSCVALGKLLTLSVLSFPYLQNERNDPHFPGSVQ